MTRLAWTQPWRDIRAWVADAGHLRMVVAGAVSAGDVMLYSWEVGRRGRHQVDIIGSHIVCGEGLMSLADAQTAAEEAALSLLLDAVAALAPDPAEDEWLSRVIDHDETFGVSVEATSLDAGDRAERLGCALIRESRKASAALKARKETDR